MVTVDSVCWHKQWLQSGHLPKDNDRVANNLAFGIGLTLLGPVSHFHTTHLMPNYEKDPNHGETPQMKHTECVLWMPIYKKTTLKDVTVQLKEKPSAKLRWLLL